MDYKILSGIKSPDDVKKLSQNDVSVLCAEIRDYLISTVSKSGGHLASNLGVVELTVAMHRIFDMPTDSIIFDVGHQCYTHKLLTGRLDRFHTLRSENGISGFMRPNESIYDPVTTGHSSSSVSAAYGIYKAKRLQNKSGTCIAVVGDGAFTGGMAYEGLNNAGAEKGNFIVVLNDNKMSISRNVGAVARYLSRIRSKPKYYKFKDSVSAILLHIPFLGKFLFRSIFKSKRVLKNAIYHSNFFEDLGFNYLGPIDGHDTKQLENIFNIAKNQNRPVLVHVMTTKGKGYKFAESQPNEYHGVSPFDIEAGVDFTEKNSFSTAFGNALVELAENDEKICAITAAMSESTGLLKFKEKFGNRFFDVGIAEQHAVTFAAGLATGGMRPVFAVYSSFLQRAYDQIIHDAAIANVPITICVDRAGLVGADGETHQGVFDVAFLSEIPNLKIYCPSNYRELKSMLKTAIYEDKITVVRYPRGCEGESVTGMEYSDEPHIIFGEGKTALITYGRIFSNVLSASKELVDTAVIKLNQVHPISNETVKELEKYDRIFFFEEGMRTGGIGEQIGQKIFDNNFKCSYKNIAINDVFVPASSVDSQLKRFGFDKESIIKTVKGE